MFYLSHWTPEDGWYPSIQVFPEEPAKEIEILQQAALQEFTVSWDPERVKRAQDWILEQEQAQSAEAKE